MRKKQTNRNLRALIITLVVLVALGILSKAENSPDSTALNAVSRGLFKLTASATASADSASTEELAAQAEALSKENAELRKQLADYIDVKKENVSSIKLLTRLDSQIAEDGGKCIIYSISLD